MTTTLPDGRAVEFAYDAKGNLTSLTPPGQASHLFDYTAVDQTKDYTPPTVDTTDPATRYSYNRDKQLELITRPDGQTLDWVYDSAGRLQTLSAPHGDTVYAYDSAGRLQSLTAPDNVMLSYGYDGSLLTGRKGVRLLFQKRGQVTFLPFLNLHRHLTRKPHGDDQHRY